MAPGIHLSSPQLASNRAHLSRLSSSMEYCCSAVFSFKGEKNDKLQYQRLVCLTESHQAHAPRISTLHPPNIQALGVVLQSLLFCVIFSSTRVLYASTALLTASWALRQASCRANEEGLRHLSHYRIHYKHTLMIASPFYGARFPTVQPCPAFVNAGGA
jgi:hypothetical protein